MSGRLPRATITLGPTHWARLEPAVPEVREGLKYPVLEFDAAGPLGHQFRPALSDRLAEVVRRPAFDRADNRVVRADVQTLPQGLVPLVRGWLGELGYELTVEDRRTDSERWVRTEEAYQKLPKHLRRMVDAVAAVRCLRVVAGTDAEVAAIVAAVAKAYPSAKIAVAMTTHKQYGRFRWRLAGRLDEPLGGYTAKKKRPGRVSVGLVRQFPRGDRGNFDLLVLPYGETAVGDGVLEVATSGQYRRILTFTRSRTVRDDDVARRLHVVAADVYPAVKEPVPVTAVILPARGTRPAVTGNPYEQKVHLYWHNTARNARIAAVARRVAAGTKRAIATVVQDPELAEDIRAAAGAAVVVLTETPVHARELAKLLPGWVVSAANDLEVPRPQPGCGTIYTELAAAETAITAGVLIRATGTRHPLSVGDWPWPGGVENGVLIDFADSFHPVARKYAQEREQGYREAGMTVRITTPGKPGKNTENTKEATGTP